MSTRTDPDDLLAALDPEQREVATAAPGPLCVLAGAGTGKTRAITHRIAYAALTGLNDPRRVLAVTYTARAAGEMRTRLRQLGVDGVQARTFHAAALRQLGYFWPKVVGGAPPRVLEHKAALIAEAAARLRLQVDRPAVRDLSAEVEWSKVSLVTAAGYPTAALRHGRGQPAGLDPQVLSRLIEVYEQLKTDRGVIDFEDVLLITAGIIEDSAQVAAAVREQYRHFVVDEYQDVSPLQQRLLQAWLGEREDLCVVGDPSQTIYSFAGASPRQLLDFRVHHPEARVVRLVRDYRSSPQVVALANRVLARAPAAMPRLELRAEGPAGPAPTFEVAQDDVEEAAAVARRVQELVRGGLRPSQIAVLYRTNGQSEPLEAALAEAGVAYLVRGGERFFARKEVRDAVLLLRGAAPGASVGQPVGEQVRAVLAGAGWSPQPAQRSGAVRERWESLQALVALTDELAAARPGCTLREVVNELLERAAAQHPPTVEGVTLASLHAAKGLEWDAVLLVGVSEGLLPISFADGPEAVEEERRLLYVGITRARRHLHLSMALARTPGGRAGRVPSRFLDGLFPSSASGPAGRTGATTRPAARTPSAGAAQARAQARTGSRCRVCDGPLRTAPERKLGRCAGCPGSYDEGLLEALRSWRGRVAAEAGLPPYVVLTDATLVAVAELRPSDRAALSQVPGVGAVKLDRYGAGVLGVLNDPETVLDNLAPSGEAQDRPPAR